MLPVLRHGEKIWGYRVCSRRGRQRSKTENIFSISVLHNGEK